MADHSQFRLLRERRFLPFFLTQALGALNDNVFRNATVLLIGFEMGLSAEQVTTYANIAPALFILPFFLFSASAGQLAEKFEKTRIIRFVKLFEIAAMSVAAWGFLTHNATLLLCVLFMMGVHSTLFGPIKYAILPQALHLDELVGGNGLVEMGTSLAILLGMMLGGILIAAAGPSGPMFASIAVIAIALIGYGVCRAIPPAPATAPQLKFNWNLFTETLRALRFVARDRVVFNAVLGISWFWFFGLVFTAQLPNYTKIYLGGSDGVYILALGLFSIGTGAGSLLCERMSGKRVEIGLVPFGSIGLTAFGIDLCFVHAQPALATNLAPLAFLRSAGGWHTAIDFTLLGVFAGFYIVPLFALVQSRADKSELSRIIAGNNILNALFMVVAAAFGIGMAQAGVSIPKIFLIAALLNAVVAIYIYTLVPEFLLRFIDWVLINTLYRIRVSGLDNIPEHGPTLLVCNHVSFMDPLIILGCVRRPVRFVMYYKIFQIPFLKTLFRAAKAIPIAGAKEDAEIMRRAFDEVDAELGRGNLVCIFPEGGITRDGEIQPFRPGVEKILARRPVPVVPLAVRGLWGSIFSRRDSTFRRLRLPRRFWSRIDLVAGAPVPAVEANAAVLEAKVRELRGDAA